MRKNALFTGILILAALGAHWTFQGRDRSIAAPRKGVVQTMDLRIAAQYAKKKNVVILLAFHDASCPYCDQMEEEVLIPMAADKANRKRVIIRKIMSGSTIRDFQGKKIAASAFAQRYGSTFTPTLFFLDHGGKELTEKIVGISNAEYISYYVEQAVKKALRRLRRSSRG